MSSHQSHSKNQIEICFAFTRIPDLPFHWPLSFLVWGKKKIKQEEQQQHTERKCEIYIRKRRRLLFLFFLFFFLLLMWPKCEVWTKIKAMTLTSRIFSFFFNKRRRNSDWNWCNHGWFIKFIIAAHKLCFFFRFYFIKKLK